MNVLTIVVVATMVAGTAIAQTVNFDNLKAGAPPPGWTGTQTDSGQAKWSIESDATAPSKPNGKTFRGCATPGRAALRDPGVWGKVSRLPLIRSPSCSGSLRSPQCALSRTADPALTLPW